MVLQKHKDILSVTFFWVILWTLWKFPKTEERKWRDTQYIYISDVSLPLTEQKKGISIKYYPTKMMVADFYTKPLQDNVFRFFRTIVININDQDIKQIVMTLGSDSRTDRYNAVANKSNKSLQECIEEEAGCTANCVKGLGIYEDINTCLNSTHK